MDIYLTPLKFYNQLLLQNLVAEFSKRFSCKIHLNDLKVNIDDFFSIERKQYYSTQILAEVINLTDNIEGKESLRWVNRMLILWYLTG